MNRLIILLL